MRIKIKIPVFSIGLVFFSTLALVVIAAVQMQSALSEEAQNKLNLSRVAKSLEIENYFSAIDDNLFLTASNPTTAGAITDLIDAWLDLGEGQKETLQALYIENNPYGAGNRHRLIAAEDDSYYSSVHAVFHPWFKSLAEARGLYDVFLFDLEGNLIYSVYKERDFATNFISGEWRNSSLGKSYRTVVGSQDPAFVSFGDFAPYGPSNNAPASFIARGVFDAEGTKIGVLAYQMPIEQLNTTMTQRTGLGETGETYLVGPDRLMRTDSRFDSETAVLRLRAETDSVLRALKGEANVATIENYRGSKVISSFQPIEFRGTRWALIAEFSEEELNAPIQEKIGIMLFASAGVIVLLGGLGFIAGAKLASPISSIAEVAGALASGELETSIPYRDKTDEVGDLAKAIGKFRDSVTEANDLRAKSEKAERLRQEAETKSKAQELEREAERERQMLETEQRAAEQQNAQRQQLADQFEAKVASIVEDLMTKAELLKQSANMVDQSANDTAERSSASYTDSQEAGARVDTVAAGAAEMSESIEAISRRVFEASDNTKSANKAAEEAVAQVDQLDTVAKKVGDVTKLIHEITEQTNLLALNATIEAARAGDAGKGFAVVASEVKSLANQTAKATEEIESEISAMLASTESATNSVRGVTNRIAQIDTIANEIATAVEQQSGKTAEIGEAASVAAEMTNRVADSIDAVGLAARANASTMSSVDGAASELLELATGLDGQVKDFVAEMRS